MSTATTAKVGFPSQIRYIIGNEAAERFSYYGMRSILTIFMVQHLLMAQADAKAVYHFFVSACYFLPLFGAYLSDKILGKYKTIMYLSLFYCVGHAVLAIWETKTGIYVGLGLIALGSGGIKPCISAHVGDQFNKTNKHLIQRVYDLFYFSVNFGSFFSTILIPWILPRYGASVAFGIPGVLMGIATFIFWLGRKEYVIVPPTRETNAAGFGSMFMYALTNQSKKKPGQGFWDVALSKYSTTDVEGAKAAWDIFKVFAFISAFWALFDQHGSSWVLQGTQMNLEAWGMKIEASQMSALNPIMVMLLIPLFSFVIYPGFEKVTGIKLTPLRKIGAGMVVAAISFAIVGLIQIPLDNGQKISVLWQTIPYLVLTASEVMISITGLEFAYTQAPRAMKSTIMSFWLLTVFAGNFFTGIVEQINVFEGATAFFFFAAVTLVFSGLFAVAAYRYKTRDYVENETDSDDDNNNSRPGYKTSSQTELSPAL